MARPCVGKMWLGFRLPAWQGVPPPPVELNRFLEKFPFLIVAKHHRDAKASLSSCFETRVLFRNAACNRLASPGGLHLEDCRLPALRLSKARHRLAVGLVASLMPAWAWRPCFAWGEFPWPGRFRWSLESRRASRFKEGPCGGPWEPVCERGKLVPGVPVCDVAMGLADLRLVDWIPWISIVAWVMRLGFATSLRRPLERPMRSIWRTF